jgi:phage baseplate assembly protein W
MKGMDAQTGMPIEDLEHLKQSIHDILSTPIGSRVMRRDYGSRIMELVDRPMNAELVADLQAAVVMSITAHEPRLHLTKVEVSLADPDLELARREMASGKLVVNLEGYYMPEGRRLVLENIAI